MKMNPLLIFENATIDYVINKTPTRAVSDVSLSIEKGKITAIVGESGSGKTTLVSSAIKCISSPGKLINGHVLFVEDDKFIDINSLSESEINKLRWKKISMVFQASQSTLNPLMTIYDQFYETAYYHQSIESKDKFDEHIRDLFNLVKLDANRILKTYPHQLSGGMKQRVMIAFALLLNPQLLILDEPTTALDVITQEYIFNQLIEINKNIGITMILLTHDIGAVAKMADNVAVMYAGSVMEYADVYTVFSKKMHPYTEGLIDATPSLVKNASDIRPIEGNPPDIRNLPTGCPFHNRCPKCMEICKTEKPELIEIEKDHYLSCHLYHR